MARVSKGDLDRVRAAALQAALDGQLDMAKDLKKVVDAIETDQAEEAE